MSTETTNKKIKIDNGTTFGKTYTDKAIDERLQGLVSTTTFTPVKEKANNSLQKPTGLTKTELVGVGTNGQENIEIGDNLTLANDKLSATGGGLPELVLTVNSEGNITVNTTDIKDGVYSLTINYDGTLVKNYGIGNICTTPYGTKVFSGYIGEDSSLFSINLQETNIISTYYVPLMADGIISHSIPYFNDSDKLECLLSPGVDYNFLSYDTKSKKYLWLPLTAGVKIISLFGKYSILVPKDSADTIILPLPSDASTSTYVLKAVNGTVQWVKES